jgi:hypothetical protein
LGLGWLLRASLPRRLHEPNGGHPMTRDISEAKCGDLRGSLAAMKRAALEARRIAIETDTGIVVVRDGKIVHISAAELREGKE